MPTTFLRSFICVFIITNLVSAVPFIGMEMVYWLWGGFSVSGATLSRFYSLHFILPFFIVFLVLIHLMSLHVSGSSNPLGVNSNLYKMPFHIYFTIKDMQLFLLMGGVLLLLCCMNPYILGDPEDFNMANSMVTPIHIQPEWYFLFAYAILRPIPNKLGGVIELFLSVSVIMVLPFLSFVNFQGLGGYPFNQVLFWFFVNSVILLTWVGSKPIDYPYVQIGQILTFLYFMYYWVNFYVMKFWDLENY